MLLEESHGHLGWCLCEGIYAWGAKSETCWVSSVFHSISQPEALAEPEGTKNYVWHFPSSLPFLCPLKSCCHYTDKSECTNIYTHTCASLWLEMSTVPPLLVFIPELLPPVYVSFLALVSLQTPSQVTYAANVLPVFLHPSPLNYCINVSTNFLILLLVEIASTNEQFVQKPLHLLLHDYTIVRCLWVTGINPCTKSASCQWTVWPGHWK